jgi:hypothetical protein
MTAEVQHTDVAAYALGLLEEEDRRAFEAHLGQCTLCAEELGDFAGMADFLREVPPLEAETPEEQKAGGQVIDLLRRRKVAERSRRRGTALLGAAAGVVLLAGGVTAGLAAAGDHSPRPAADVFASPDKATATDTTTGVTGTVAMENKGWGTDIGLRLTHLKGPLTCKMVAVTKTGRKVFLMNWRVPAKGYGLPGSPMRDLQVHGSTAVNRADIARVDVQVEGTGRTLLSIPV